MKGAWRQELAELAVDGLIASLLAAGTAYGVLLWFNLEWPVSAAILTSLVLTVLIATFSRRWYITPLIAVLTLFVIFGSQWLHDQLDDTIELIAGFFRWGRTWLQIGQGNPENESWTNFLRVFLFLPANLFWFFLIRRINRLFVHAAAAILVFTPLLFFYQQSIVGLLIALAGLTMLVPRHFIRLVRREKPGGTRFSRIPLQLLALPIALVSLLLAQSFVPDQTRNWRLPALAHPINDIGDLISLQIGQTRGWTSFGIGAYGYQPFGGRLGGPARLSTNHVLRVGADSPFLLKGSSRAVYTGFSWESADSSYHRLGSGLWWLIKQQTFNDNLPGGAAGSAFKRNFSREITITVEPVTGGLASIFTAGRVKSVDLDHTLDYPVYFTTTGDLFVFGGLPRGTVYLVKSDYFDRQITGFDQAMLQLEIQAASTKDSRWDLVRDLYLQLPEDLPERVRETARAVVSPEASPYLDRKSVV